jgi:hypothetical protein
LAGNFFGTRVKYGRYDANRGVLLLGDGKGNFDPVNNFESGLNIDGEVRDIMAVQLPNKKQLIIFTQNDDALKTYTFEPKTDN